MGTFLLIILSFAAKGVNETGVPPDRAKEREIGLTEAFSPTYNGHI